MTVLHPPTHQTALMAAHSNRILCLAGCLGCLGCLAVLAVLAGCVRVAFCVMRQVVLCAVEGGRGRLARASLALLSFPLSLFLL